MLNFTKNSKGEILNLFFKNPEKEYYLREIAKNFGKEPGYFQKAINDLVLEGILKDERKANLRYFRLNKKYPLYEEIKRIISKTLGMEFKLKEIINNLEAIDYAFIFGSIAKDKENVESDIDLMIVGGEVDQDSLIKKVNQAEEELKREINYHIYSKEEIINGIKEGNDFLVKIFNESKIILKGNPDELTRTN